MKVEYDDKHNRIIMRAETADDMITINRLIDSGYAEKESIKSVNISLVYRRNTGGR